MTWQFKFHKHAIARFGKYAEFVSLYNNIVDLICFPSLSIWLLVHQAFFFNCNVKCQSSLYMYKCIVAISAHLHATLFCQSPLWQSHQSPRWLRRAHHGFSAATPTTILCTTTNRTTTTEPLQQDHYNHTNEPMHPTTNRRGGISWFTCYILTNQMVSRRSPDSILRTHRPTIPTTTSRKMDHPTNITKNTIWTTRANTLCSKLTTLLKATQETQKSAAISSTRPITPTTTTTTTRTTTKPHNTMRANNTKHSQITTTIYRTTTTDTHQHTKHNIYNNHWRRYAAISTTTTITTTTTTTTTTITTTPTTTISRGPQPYHLQQWQHQLWRQHL